MSIEITRKTEIVVETKRQFVVSPAKPEARIFCPQCGGLMLTAEQCAAVFGISRRAVYRRIEIDLDAHLFETASGIVFLCPDSFAGSDLLILRENL